MHRDAAPVVAAQALLAHGMADDAITDYLCRAWPLDPIDAVAAVEAARTLNRHDHRPNPHDGRRSLHTQP